MDSPSFTPIWCEPNTAGFFRGGPELVRLLSGPAWHHARVGVPDVTARLIEQACASGMALKGDHSACSSVVGG